MEYKSKKNCPICGKFMRKLKFIEKIRLSFLDNGSEYTHICRSSTIRYSDGFIDHK